MEKLIKAIFGLNKPTCEKPAHASYMNVMQSMMPVKFDALSESDALAKIRLHDAAEDMFLAIKACVDDEINRGNMGTLEDLYRWYAQSSTDELKNAFHRKILIRAAYMRATGIDPAKQIQN